MRCHMSAYDVATPLSIIGVFEATNEPSSVSSQEYDIASQQKTISCRCRTMRLGWPRRPRTAKVTTNISRNIQGPDSRHRRRGRRILKPKTAICRTVLYSVRDLPCRSRWNPPACWRRRASRSTGIVSIVTGRGYQARWREFRY